MIPKARFCSFDMRSHSKPQFVIPNWRCERINESYINFIAERGKYRLSLFITPSVRDILLAIFCVCEFQFMYSFTVNPRKLNSCYLFNQGVVYHKTWYIISRYNPLAIMKYHKFSFLYIER